MKYNHCENSANTLKTPAKPFWHSAEIVAIYFGLKIMSDIADKLKN